MLLGETFGVLDVRLAPKRILGMYSFLFHWRGSSEVCHVSCPAVICQVSWIRHLCGWRRRATAPLKLDPQGETLHKVDGGTHYQKTSYQNIVFFAKESQLKIFSCRIPGLGGWVWISLTWFLLVRLWGMPKKPKKPKKPKLPTKTHKNRRTKSCFVRSSETRSVTRSWKLWRSGYFMFCIFFSLDSGSSKKTFQRVEMTPLDFAIWHFMMCLDPPVPGMLPQLDERW